MCQLEVRGSASPYRIIDQNSSHFCDEFGDLFPRLGKTECLTQVKPAESPGISLAYRALAMAKKTFGAFGSMMSVLLFVASTAAAYEASEVVNGGMIRGTVKVAGKLPKLPLLDVTIFKEVCQEIGRAHV